MTEGIQRIIQHIDSDAGSHADERLAQLKAAEDREISLENAAVRSELEQRRDVLLAQNESELRHRLERHSRRLNRSLLTYRRELLDGIFDMAVRELSNISEKEYSDIFIAATRDLSGSFSLFIGEYSREKLGAQSIAQALALNSGLSITLDPGFIPNRSGFIIKNGRVEYNYLFEDLIEDKKSEQAALILKEVFEDV